MNYCTLLKDAINSALGFLGVLTEPPNKLFSYLEIIQETLLYSSTKVVVANATTLSAIADEAQKIAHNIVPQTEQEIEVIAKLNTEIGYLIHYLDEIISVNSVNTAL